MKRKILIAALLTLLINATAAAPANATECKSIAQVTGDIWKKWGTVVIASGCVVVAAATTAVGALDCLKAAGYEKAVEEMVTYYNQKVNNSWATVGPRRIEFGTDQDGTLIAPSGRVFLTAAPLDKDLLKIKIKKLDGEAKTTIVICRIDSDNTAHKLAEYEFVKGDANAGQEFVKVVSGVKNQLVQVHLESDTLGKKFHFTFRADK